MTLSEVLQLIGAGYTKPEIEAMAAQDELEVSITVSDQTAAEPPTASDQTAAEPPTASPEAVEVHETAQVNEDIRELKDAVKTLTTAFQAAQLANARQPAQPSIQEQADSLIQNLI